MKRFWLTVFFLAFAASSHALTLQAAVDTAVKNNPAVIASQKKLDAAQARLAQATGAFLPTVKLDGNYGKSYTQPQTVQITGQNFTFGTDAVTDTRGWSLSLSQPLFVAGLFPGYGIAQKSARLAQEELNRVLLETRYNAIAAYYSALLAEKSFALAEQAKEMAESHRDKVKSMLNAGAATQADFLRAQVQLANSETARARAKNGREISKNVFNNALGLNLEEAVALDEQDFPAAISALPDYNNLLAWALESRPDWSQYLLSRQIEEENLRISQTAYLPTLKLTGLTGNHVTEYPTYKSDVNSWSITGAVAWTLFDGLGIQNRIREAAANLEASRAAERQVKNGIALEVREAYLNLETALETINSSKKAVESAEENYRVSNRLFNSGVGTNLEVINAQVSLTQLRISYYQSFFDLAVARAKINKSIGREIL